MDTIPLHRADDEHLGELVRADVERFGISAASGALDQAQIDRLRNLMDHAVAEDLAWLPEDRLEREYGRVVFLARYGREFLDLLEMPAVFGPCESIVGEDCKIYTMTSICRPPGGVGWPVHVDSGYVVPGFIVAVGVIVLLDDFTVESGATRFYPELVVDEPDPRDFEGRALRLEAPAGSVCWFHGRSWHDALPNQTDRWRRAVLFAATRPWVAQRFDMARMLAHLGPETFSPSLRRKLGLDVLPPGTYSEYYLTPAERRRALLARAARDNEPPLCRDLDGPRRV